MRGQNKLVRDIYVKYREYFDYAQFACLLLVAIALGARYMGKDLSPLLVIGFCTLAFLFGVKGIAASADRAIGELILNMGLSVLCMGLLYQIQHWPGSENMLYAGAAGTTTGVIARIFFSRKNENEPPQ